MNKTTLLAVFALTVLTLDISVNAQFIKISNQGKILDNNTKSWSCVLDSNSKLIWEIKSIQKGLQNAQNTYTWFDKNSGVENGKYSHNCHWGENCNSQKYISALNEVALCSLSQWRLPTLDELQSLIVYGDSEPLINIELFPIPSQNHIGLH